MIAIYNNQPNREREDLGENILRERERERGLWEYSQRLKRESLGENILIEDSVGIFSETEERESW